MFKDMSILKSSHKLALIVEHYKIRGICSQIFFYLSFEYFLVLPKENHFMFSVVEIHKKNCRSSSTYDKFGLMSEHRPHLRQYVLLAPHTATISLIAKDST